MQAAEYFCTYKQINEGVQNECLILELARSIYRSANVVAPKWNVSWATLRVLPNSSFELYSNAGTTYGRHVVGSWGVTPQLLFFGLMQTPGSSAFARATT